MKSLSILWIVSLISPCISVCDDMCGGEFLAGQLVNATTDITDGGRIISVGEIGRVVCMTDAWRDLNVDGIFDEEIFVEWTTLYLEYSNTGDPAGFTGAVGCATGCGITEGLGIPTGLWTDGCDQIGVIGECPEGEFVCDESECVLEALVCDGNYDCSNAADEILCECEFRCDNSACLAIEHVCDDIPDCLDGEDEADSECIFECMSESVPSHMVCDGTLDCSYGEDELPCGCSGFWACWGGEGCIYEEYVCDGFPDCTQESDEYWGLCLSTNDCTGHHECSSDEYCDELDGCLPCDQCIFGFPIDFDCYDCDECHTSTECLDTEFCDLFYMCRPCEECTLSESADSDCARCNNCPEGEFSCVGSECILQELVCDGNYDCPNSADEVPCECEFRCDNSACLASEQVCDDILDCPDGEDEAAMGDCPNEGCVNAILIGMGTTIGDTSLTLPQLILDGDCFFGREHIREIWYSVTGTGRGIFVSTCGETDFDSIVSIWDPDCEECIDYSDDSHRCVNSQGSYIEWVSEVNVTYKIQVHGFFEDDVGIFELTVGLAPDCTAGSFVCWEGEGCIPGDSVCDGVYDCNTREDEQNGCSLYQNSECLAYDDCLGDEFCDGDRLCRQCEGCPRDDPVYYECSHCLGCSMHDECLSDEFCDGGIMMCRPCDECTIGESEDGDCSRCIGAPTDTPTEEPTEATTEATTDAPTGECGDICGGGFQAGQLVSAVTDIVDGGRTVSAGEIGRVVCMTDAWRDPDGDGIFDEEVFVEWIILFLQYIDTSDPVGYTGRVGCTTGCGDTGGLDIPTGLWTDGCDQILVIEECPDGDFVCGEDECISGDLVCDGNWDCGNMADEVLCDCADAPEYVYDCIYWASDNGCDDSDFVKENCRLSCGLCEPECQFRCDSGACLANEKVCDDNFDCPDGEDEAEITCYFECYTYGELVPVGAVCDGSLHCEDGSDELPCGCPNHWDCDGESCIPNEYVCDGFEDCQYGSDENWMLCYDMGGGCNYHSDCTGDSYCDVNGDCWSPCSDCWDYLDAIDGYCPCTGVEGECTSHSDCDADSYCDGDFYECWHCSDCIPDYSVDGTCPCSIDGACPCPDPTDAPTLAPTSVPTDAPTEPTGAPTELTEAPTESTAAPTEQTEAPTEAPTEVPTEVPTEALVGAIGNLVFLDRNQNGVQDNPAESGIADVTLLLTSPVLDPGGVTTTTDANGNYLFDVLPAGDYTVAVTDDNNILLGFAPTTSASRDITLAAGQSAFNEDFGYFISLENGSTVFSIGVTLGVGAEVNGNNGEAGDIKDVGSTESASLVVTDAGNVSGEAPGVGVGGSTESASVVATDSGVVTGEVADVGDTGTEGSASVIVTGAGGGTIVGTGEVSVTGERDGDSDIMQGNIIEASNSDASRIGDAADTGSVTPTSEGNFINQLLQVSESEYDEELLNELIAITGEDATRFIIIQTSSIPPSEFFLVAILPVEGSVPPVDVYYTIVEAVENGLPPKFELMTDAELHCVSNCDQIQGASTEAPVEAPTEEPTTSPPAPTEESTTSPPPPTEEPLTHEPSTQEPEPPRCCGDRPCTQITEEFICARKRQCYWGVCDVSQTNCCTGMVPCKGIKNSLFCNSKTFCEWTCE